METRDIYINGVKTFYTINENAEIYNTITGTQVVGWIEKRGYRAVSLRSNPDTLPAEFVRRTVHRLMGIHFLPNPKNLPVINHKDGNKLNNKLENLEWASYQYNYDHARSHGLIKTCDALSYATVDNKTVHTICKLLDAGKRNIEIIDELGLPNDQYGKSLITRIRTGKEWKDISSQYDFIKTGSLKKVPDFVIHEICKRLEQNKPLKEIFTEVGLVNSYEYPRFKGLVYDIRTRKVHKGISSKYQF